MQKEGAAVEPKLDHAQVGVDQALQGIDWSQMGTVGWNEVTLCAQDFLISGKAVATLPQKL